MLENCARSAQWLLRRRLRREPLQLYLVVVFAQTHADALLPKMNRSLDFDAVFFPRCSNVCRTFETARGRETDKDFSSA